MRFGKGAAFLFFLAALCSGWAAAASTIPLRAEPPRMDLEGCGFAISLTSKAAGRCEDDTALAGLVPFDAPPRHVGPDPLATPSRRPATVTNPFLSTAP